MTRWLIAIALALLAGQSQAGVLRCSFTEPFFSITFDSNTGKVIWISPDVFDESGNMVPEVLAEGARLQLLNPYGDERTFRIETDTRYILQLRFTGEGSDGMSESMFPFEATYGSNIGGCETEKYPAFDLYDMVEDLGVKH